MFGQNPEPGTRAFEMWAQSNPQAAQAHLDMLEEQRERNEEAKARFRAEQKAEKQATHDRAVAQRQAEIEAEIEAYKLQARTAFPGSEVQFAAAWPNLLREWQTRVTQERLNAVIEEKRRKFGSL